MASFSDASAATTAPPQVAAFSPSRRFLAVVLDSSSLKVWDTRTGQLHNDYTPADHLENDLTSLAWTTARDGGEEQDSLLALGNSAGDITVWNVVTAEVQSELRKTNAQIQGSIHHLAINSAQTHLYACSDASSIVEYSLQTGTLGRSLTTEDGGPASVGGFSRLALSFDGSKLLAAGSHIALWDLTSGAQLASFVGHASAVRDLAFLPSGKHFVSADADKFLNVWSARGSSAKSTKARGRKVKTHSKARLRLIASGDVHAVHVQTGSNGGHTANICCLCRNGDIDLWQVDAKKDKESAPQPAHATICCEAGDEEGAAASSNAGSNGGVFALSRGIARAGSSDSAAATTAVICARGLALQPKFESVAIEDNNGDVVASVLDFLDTEALLKSRRAGGRGGNDVVADATVGSSAATQRGAHIAGARDSTAGITGQKRRAAALGTAHGPGSEDGDDSHSSKRAAADAEDEDGGDPDLETLEERLQTIQHFAEKPGSGNDSDDGDDGHGANGHGSMDFGSASQSLVTILQQALQANDKAKLEYCLAVHDKEIITTTINKLPAACILPFLRQLVDRLERSPRRGRVLTNWIRKILLRHTAYLMTVPDLAKELAALYEIIASRSALYTKFCRLSGRVDVLLAQLTHRKSLQLAAKQKPVVYKGRFRCG
eukprot:INCI19294.1.p1 GENE.INCI19294.1~~INCI19294.1.p1  ORF type:complete len:662 (+),score=143.22 INCI19294.1:551-2536(+)